MLVIRPEQLDALELAHARLSVRPLAAQCRRFFPTHVAGRSEDDCVELIDVALLRAWSHGIRGSADLHAYARIAFVAGISFEWDEALRTVLTNPTLTSGQKVRAILDRAQDWFA
ncbi:MAG: hypothetical protein JOZ54_20780 [Acidobacteria bacterium]|nr:hypothetical protein [Acidobacteriota bacterium]